MKLIRSNGRELNVYDIGPALMTLKAADVPLPLLDMVMNEDIAREKLKELISCGLYLRET